MPVTRIILVFSLLAIFSSALLLAPTTPTTQAQNDGLTFDFAQYDGNPVLTAGERGDWDVGGFYGHSIIEHEGTIYLFYVGLTQLTGNFNARIGFATSTDGYSWTKSPSNPIIDGGSHFTHAASPVVWIDDETWHLLITEASSTSLLPVGRYWHATAPSPDGPWAIDDVPMIDTSELGWDRYMYLDSMVRTEDEYRLYYTGMTRRYQNPQIGLATSPDGATWTFHNDPATSDSGFENSDPILTMGEEGSYESVGVGGTDILPTDEGWETFFVGIFDTPTATASPDRDVLQFGYATSTDGITWTKHALNPIFETGITAWPLASAIRIDDTYFIYYDIRVSAGPPYHLGLITGTITR